MKKQAKNLGKNKNYILGEKKLISQKRGLGFRV